MTFDFAAATDKAEDLPPPEDGPIRAEVLDVESTKMSVLDLQVGAGQNAHILPLCVGQVQLSLRLKFLRKIETLSAQRTGLIVKVTLLNEQALFGFVPANEASQLSGKAGLGSFSLPLNKTKSVTFR
jgi:hypothetical protein